MIKTDKLQDLVKYQNLLREASFYNIEFMKKQAIDRINNVFPDIANEVSREWYKRYPNGGLKTLDSVYKLSPEGTNDNVFLYLYVISNRINQHYNWSVSSTAIQRIFLQPQPLSDEYELYEKNGEQLTVAKFMSVLSYGKKFSEAFFGVDSPKTSEYMLAIKTVDLAINHKEVDKPLNKTLHIINDVLTEYAKALQKDKSGKMVVSGISLLVDLSIDFLVKG